MEKQYTAEEVVEYLQKRLMASDNQTALAKQLGIKPQLVSMAISAGYLTPALADALGFEPIKRLYRRKMGGLNGNRK